MASGDIIRISGGDFKDSTPSINSHTTSSSTNVNVVSVTGKGFFTGIFQSLSGGGNTGSNGYITIIVDGVTVINNVIMTQSYFYSDSRAVTFGSMPCIIRFNSSLTVQHRTTGGTITTVANLALD